MRHLLPALLLAALLAACSPAPSTVPAAPPRATSAPPVPPTPPTGGPRPAPAPRAAAAGLSDAQAAALAALGVPVAVPVRPEGWAVARVEAARASGAPRYRIDYAAPGGACVAVVGETEGLGDVFAAEPPAQLAVDVRGLATSGPVALGWSGRGAGEAEGWPGARVQSEWFGVDGVAYSVLSPSGDGCAAATPETMADVLASMRALDPLDDGPSGAWAPGLDAEGTGATPEAAARAAFAGEGRAATAVEVLNARAAHAVVVVTTTGAADDSVEGVRTRAVVVADGGRWTVRQAWQQMRCRTGRGHPDWSAEPCR